MDCSGGEGRGAEVSATQTSRFLQLSIVNFCPENRPKGLIFIKKDISYKYIADIRGILHDYIYRKPQ